MAAFLVDHQTRFPVSYFPFEPRSRTGCVWTGLRCTAREKVRVDGSKKRRASKFFPLGAYSPQPRNEEKQTRSTRCLSVEERKLRGTRAAAVWPGEFFALLESGVLSLFFFSSFLFRRNVIGAMRENFMKLLTRIQILTGIKLYKVGNLTLDWEKGFDFFGRFVREILGRESYRLKFIQFLMFRINCFERLLDFQHLSSSYTSD